MATSESLCLARTTSYAALIAWLSVCILVACWGPQLDPLLRQRWAWAGPFGLAAAVGLELSDRTRALIKKRSLEKTTNRRIGYVTDAVLHQDGHSEFADVIRKIQEASKTLAAGGEQPNGDEASKDSRSAFPIPVSVRLLKSDAKPGSLSETPSLMAHLRNISSIGIGLVHQARIDTPRYVLDFVLPSGERLLLLVEVRWQERSAYGTYHSGGKLLKILESADEEVCCVGSSDTWL